MSLRLVHRLVSGSQFQSYKRLKFDIMTRAFSGPVCQEYWEVVFLMFRAMLANLGIVGRSWVLIFSMFVSHGGWVTCKVDQSR